ncbi:PepSY domain-containing protein [Acinetobacter qingfengensis]|uniref:Peptidase n=1 Tax=Acinetobacter qingfengensis TaxID=1262585 RepID=A0A1E7REM7_9GAMM|nr:PepSY domain-containing protein [Acinetobacter qingfengensis]OEY97781.1 peptidase [Acinetobacter qingfengensis]
MLHLCHYSLAIFLAPFIFVAAFTGVLYGATPQLEQMIYQKILYVDQLPKHTAYPLSQQVYAAYQVLPHDAVITSVRPAPSVRDTTRVVYVQEQHPDKNIAIFVNPNTLAIQGQLQVYGTSGVLPLRLFLDQLHRSLLLGEWGRSYSELAASWLGIFAMTGIMVWWLSRHKKQPQSHNRFWHKTIGLAILPMLLFFSLTGLTWSKWAGANIAQIRHWFNQNTPSLNLQLNSSIQKKSDPHAEHHLQMTPQHQHPILDLSAFDNIIYIARQQGLQAQALQIKPSNNLQKAWSIEEINHRWPIQIDALAVDMSTQQITDRLSFASFPWSAKLTRWGVDLHIGVLFGWINQLFLLVGGLLMMLLIFMAYRMWWQHARPLQTLFTLQKQLGHIYLSASKKQRLILFSILFLIGILLPIWLVSLILINGCVGIIAYLRSKNSHKKCP